MIKALLGVILLLPAPLQEKEKAFTVAGAVTLVGDAPKPKRNKALEDDPPCCALHQNVPPRDNLVVGEKGGVKWAFVWVKKGLEGKTFKAPEAPVVMDQVGCIFTPHVVGILAGQTVQFKNSDPMLHNVFGAGFANPGFNFAVVPGGVRPVTYQNAEVMFKVSCNVHPWMAAWIGVVDHPYFAVTDADGRFELKGLPAGTYTLGVWHEELQAPDQEIKVHADRTVEFAAIKRKAN